MGFGSQCGVPVGAVCVHSMCVQTDHQIALGPRSEVGVGIPMRNPKILPQILLLLFANTPLWCGLGLWWSESIYAIVLPAGPAYCDTMESGGLLGEESRDPATQCCWPDCPNKPLFNCSSCKIVRYCCQSCQKLHWKSGHKVACKRKGRVDFAIFNIPQVAKAFMPVDNEPNNGGVAEPIRRRLVECAKPDPTKDPANLNDLVRIKRILKECTTARIGESPPAILLLQDYYITREIFEASIGTLYGEHDGSEAYFQMLRDLYEKYATLFDPFRESVDEEMLLCELVLLKRKCMSHHLKKRPDQGAVHQDFEDIITLARRLPVCLQDIQSKMFRTAYYYKAEEPGGYEEGLALCLEMYDTICKETGISDPSIQGVVSDMAFMAARWGGDIDLAEHWARTAADNLESYVRHVDFDQYAHVGNYLANDTLPVIIARIPSEDRERKAALLKLTEGLFMDILADTKARRGANDISVAHILTDIILLRMKFQVQPSDFAANCIDLAMSAYRIYHRDTTEETRAAEWRRYYDTFTILCGAIVAYFMHRIALPQEEELSYLKAALFLCGGARKCQPGVDEPWRNRSGQADSLDSLEANLGTILNMRQDLLAALPSILRDL